MISLDEYLAMINDVIKKELNDKQIEVIKHSDNQILHIVAGPGSGKTTVLVLRALRNVFVDDILPENILITTFTRKAAKELRSRWLEWGYLLKNCLSNEYDTKKIDLNRCVIDTLDSTIQQVLSEHKLAGDTAPIVIEESTAMLLFKNNAFRNIYQMNKVVLNKFLKELNHNNDDVSTQSEALKITKTLCDRLVQDLVNLDTYRKTEQAQCMIVEVLESYRNYLSGRNLYDFCHLEKAFLDRMKEEKLSTWIEGIKVLLIDEYKDTNPLQEAIYFSIIAKSVPNSTIVGDDDQSMYRFRGGSVELFTQFEKRCLEKTDRNVKRIDLLSNYRSSEEIVSFYNSHILNDPEFSQARMNPPKREVISMKGNVGIPVLGMFRENPQALSESLSDWISDLFTRKKWIHNQDGANIELSVSPLGNIGDCVLLSYSARDQRYDRFKKTTGNLFPSYFRESMNSRGLKVFNPRGYSLRDVLDVQRLLGLLIECIDPMGMYTDDPLLSNEERYYLNKWRQEANDFISQNPMPADKGGIKRFVGDWKANSQSSNTKCPNDWPVLEIVFRLLSWFPDFQKNPEHQVWLEAITRIIANTSIASKYKMLLQKDDPHRKKSRVCAIRDAILPIANNEVDVDEDIMPSIPRNWLPIMTIHQAKGLEFPLVIVDVGSRFSSDHYKQRFLRFPDRTSNTVLMEENVEPHLISSLRSNRSPIDRSFDDLVRLFYVAYSRPKTVLLLIGNEKCLSHGDKQNKRCIPNIALSWCRDRTWPWKHGYSENKKPPVMIEPKQFVLI